MENSNYTYDSYELYKNTLKEYIWLAQNYDTARKYVRLSALRGMKNELEKLNDWQNYFLEQSAIDDIYKNADIVLRNYMSTPDSSSVRKRKYQ